jgi:D-arginine utilization repressor
MRVSLAKDMPSWARPFCSTCEAVALLLSPHAEVALHDLAEDAVLGLWNPISGRKAGDPSLIDELPCSWREHPVQGPYRKVLADGREIGSVSAVIRDNAGEDRGLLCVNLDRTPLLDLAAVLGALAAPRIEPPRELFELDWREQIALCIAQSCDELNYDRARLTRSQRLELVRELERRGLFATRNAAEHVAHAIGISRATTYGLLKEVRGGREPAGLQA